MANRIREIRKARGTTQAILAGAADTSTQQVQRLESGSRKLTQEWMGRLAKALGVEPAAFISDAPIEELLRKPQIPSTNRDKGKTSTTLPPQSIPTIVGPPTPHDIEVRGTGACTLGQGAFQLEETVVERVRRPYGILEVKDAYAIYVVGDSMEPCYHAGDLVFVSGSRPPRVGDHVVVQVQNGQHEGVQSYIKRLERRTEQWLHLAQYNPKTQIKIKTSTVKAVHRIFSVNELYGI